MLKNSKTRPLSIKRPDIIPHSPTIEPTERSIPDVKITKVIPIARDFDELGFKIGKGIDLNPGEDVTIAATGHLVWEALLAAEQLEAEGIAAEVINIHTIKPLDEALIIESVLKTGAIVTAEEHNYIGGLGESISGALSKNHPTPQEYVATQDTFGESGSPIQLMEKYGLNKNAIISASKRVLARK